MADEPHSAAPAGKVVSLREFGVLWQARADGGTASAKLIAGAADAAAARGEGAYIPSGTYWIDAESGTGSGLKLDLPDHTRMELRGETGSVIKRRPAAVVAPTSALVFIHANEGINLTFRRLTLDGNEAAAEYDAATPRCRRAVGQSEAAAGHRHVLRPPVLRMLSGQGAHRRWFSGELQSASPPLPRLLFG